MKIGIMGFGVEGRAVLEYFQERGHQITVCDRAPLEIKDASFEKVETNFGPRYLDDLDRYDLIFRSPGIPALKKEFDPVRSKVTSLTRYFFDHAPCPIVGITGTKGKGTTAMLLYKMIKTALAQPVAKGGAAQTRLPSRVFLGGNIGTPPIGLLDDLGKDDLVILELSSFQLQDLGKSPHIAVVLNVTSDHLDYHRDAKEYAEAKKNIVHFQRSADYAVLDYDNENARSFGKETKAQLYYFSTEKPVKRGGFVKVGSLVIADGETGIIFGEKGRTGLIGDHNVKNILAAATAAHILKVPVEVISKTVREFKGLPHRLEFVDEINGALFYNDSASTNPDTAIAAIRAFRNPTILIAGGSEKNADMEPLAEEIAKRPNVKTVILMGQTKAKLENAIEKACIGEQERIAKIEAEDNRLPPRRQGPLELITSESYEEAFMVARLLAQPGDTVLFSPACASFDMFANYKERGDIFRNFILDAARNAESTELGKTPP